MGYQKIGSVITGISFGGNVFHGLTRKFGRVLRQSLARPFSERRGRATSPVARLSVWFIPWFFGCVTV